MKEHKYEEICQYIIGLIHDNGLSKDDKLPTEKELAEQFEVSRITVQRALKELQQNGTVYRIQGGGTFVGGPQEEAWPNQNLFPLVLANNSQHYRSMDFVNGLQSYLFKHNCYTTVHISNNDDKQEQDIINSLVKNGMQQIIILPVEKGDNTEFYFGLLSKGIKLIFIDRKPPDLPCSLVSCDNFSGGYLATRHLLEKGHRQIAFITNVKIGQASSVDQRLSGYRRALLERGVACDEQYILFADDKVELEAKVKELMERPNAPTAIFSVNDYTAIDLMSILGKCGKQIPNDVALIGFDNLSVTDGGDPFLTSVDQPFFAIGYNAGKLAYRICKERNTTITQMALPVSVIERESTGHPNSLIKSVCI